MYKRLGFIATAAVFGMATAAHAHTLASRSPPMSSGTAPEREACSGLTVQPAFRLATARCQLAMKLSVF